MQTQELIKLLKDDFAELVASDPLSVRCEQRRLESDLLTPWFVHEVTVIQSQAPRHNYKAKKH